MIGRSLSRAMEMAVESMTPSRFFQSFHVADRFELHGVVEFGGVLVVHAVHLGGLEDGVALEFQGAQGGRRIRGEIGVAGTGGADDHAAFVHVSERPAANVRFRHVRHLQGGHDPCVAAVLFQGVLHCQGVHDRGQHAHVVALGAVHALGRGGHAAKDVAAADDQGYLEAGRGHLGDFFCELADGFRFDAELLAARKGLAAEFQ